MDEETGQSGRVTGKRFAEILKIGQPALTKMLDDKLTAGISYFRKGRGIEVDLVAAKIELASKINPRTCKQPGILTFIGIEKEAATGAIHTTDLQGMNPHQVAAETRKVELSILKMQERKMAGELVEKVLVEKNLASFAILIRDALTGIPQRIIAQLRNAPSDQDAENILYAEIEGKLTLMSNTLNQDVAAE